MLEISLPVNILTLVIMLIIKMRGYKINKLLLAIFIISLVFVALSLLTFFSMPY